MRKFVIRLKNHPEIITNYFHLLLCRSSLTFMFTPNFRYLTVLHQ
jgi:hypothetical protein